MQSQVAQLRRPNERALLATRQCMEKGNYGSPILGGLAKDYLARTQDLAALKSHPDMDYLSRKLRDYWPLNVLISCVKHLISSCESADRVSPDIGRNLSSRRHPARPVRGKVHNDRSEYYQCGRRRCPTSRLYYRVLLCGEPYRKVVYDLCLYGGVCRQCLPDDQRSEGRGVRRDCSVS